MTLQQQFGTNVNPQSKSKGIVTADISEYNFEARGLTTMDLAVQQGNVEAIEIMEACIPF